MVAPGMLQNPSVKAWLAGVEPAWTLLDQASFAALHEPPSPMGGPIRLATDLTQEEIRQSAVARSALIVLRAAATAAGLKMTAAGNLSRAVVAEMRDLLTWPDYDKAEAFQFHRVINEPDFLPLYFVRTLVQAGTLLRKRKGHLKVTPAGRRMMEEPNMPAAAGVTVPHHHVASRPQLSWSRPASWMATTRRGSSALVFVRRCDRLADA